MNQNYHHHPSHLSQHLFQNNPHLHHHRTSATCQVNQTLRLNHGQQLLPPPPPSSSQQMPTMYTGRQNEIVTHNAPNIVNCTNYQGQHLYDMPQYIQQSEVSQPSDGSAYCMQSIAPQVESATTFYQQQQIPNHQNISYDYQLPYGSQLRYVTQLDHPNHSQAAVRQCDIALPAPISEMQQRYHRIFDGGSSSGDGGAFSQYQTVPMHNNYYHHHGIQQSAQHHQAREVRGGANKFSDQTFDQNQIYYQDHMDLHPTIKQQEDQQAYLLDQSVSADTGSVEQVSSPIPAVETYGSQTYGQQLMVHTEDSLVGAAGCQPDHLAGSRLHNSQLSSHLAARPQQRVVTEFAGTNIAELSDPTDSDTLNGSISNVPLPNSQNRKSSIVSATIPYLDERSQQNRKRQDQCESNDGDCIQQQQVDRPISETKRKQENSDEFVDMGSGGCFSQDWLDNICSHLIEHMNRFGICVIDNFLGPHKGDLILGEVKQLYSGGQYTKGRLVNNKVSSRGSSAVLGAIRNDRVIWIDGYEDGCVEINNLIQTLCSVVTNSCRLSLYSNNGLDKIVINKRTRAHVACYPGNGTRYIKHVDNPNGDGRVITSIYYLNKDWNTKRDGGLLRMFPTGMDEVANIEPLFDRALFFWSDRRNPHEVLPAYKDRFAITVWYIGENRS